MARQFVMGDLHGAYKALVQCLERAKFNKEDDELICLGDVADGWPEVKECFDELLTIKNLTFILGNHDQWLLFWAKGHHSGDIWTEQGGRNTQASYGNDPANVPAAHIKLLEEDAKLWLVDDNNRLYVHGGIDTQVPIEEQKIDVCLWDRKMVRLAQMCVKQKVSLERFTEFKEVFVGHTTTTLFEPGYIPLNFYEIWMLDTGAGWEGKLTLMDVETKEYFQSDKVSDLYPGIKGRR